MDFVQLFTRAVAALPEAVKRRLDGGAPLEWAEIEHLATAVALDEAINARRRLPACVETLVQRLIDDVGIAPADIAAGEEREGTAGAWTHRVAIETDGDAYRLRDRVGGEVHTGLRPEAVAGYAVLALELAAAVHEASKCWIEAGDRYRRAAGNAQDPLAQCAIRMSAQLRARPESTFVHAPTRALAGTLEYAWNAQSLDMRGALSDTAEPRAARGARAPRKRYLAPTAGYLLHVYDPGEADWLRGLAEHARANAAAGEPAVAPPARAEEAGRAADFAADDLAVLLQAGLWPETGSVDTGAPLADPDDLALSRELADMERAANRSSGAARPDFGAAAGAPGNDAASARMTALEAQIRAETVRTVTLGSEPGGLVLFEQADELERAANRLPGAVRRRLGESYGIEVMQALVRLRGTLEADTVRAGLRGGGAPGWLVELASAVLIDAGAQTRDGLRTAGLHLDPQQEPDGTYRATEAETGLHGRLTLAGLVEQMHLGLAFAHLAWIGLATLRNAGKEGGWILTNSGTENRGFSAIERETLEAAQQIERALDRIRPLNIHADRAPTALEQAAMAAQALTAVGPTIRAAAGWPGAAEVPNPRKLADIARIASVAEALHADVRSISNRLIAGQVATSAGHGDGRGDRP